MSLLPNPGVKKTINDMAPPLFTSRPKISSDNLKLENHGNRVLNRKIIHVEFLPQGTTINVDRYCQTLKNLRRIIQNKRGMLTKDVCLLHDNARPHPANVITALLDSFGWNDLRHLAHSPDLALSDFHLFLHLKQHLAGKRFETDKDVEKEMRTWLRMPCRNSTIRELRTLCHGSPSASSIVTGITKNSRDMYLQCHMLSCKK